MFLQFRRAANIYFLIISILTGMYFSPKNPSSMIGTFAFVIILTMVKEAYEDIKRYRSDQEINEKTSLVFSPQSESFLLKKWGQIKVGDLIKISENEDFPADILIIKSSNTSGICFVDTMSLDGETNLKEKISPSETKGLNDIEVQSIKGKVESELPNENLEKWEGFLHIDQSKPYLCKLNFRLTQYQTYIA